MIPSAMIDIPPFSQTVTSPVQQVHNVACTEQLSGEDDVDNAVATQPVNVRKVAEQIRNRNDTLPVVAAMVDCVYPLLAAPAPDGPPAARSLTEYVVEGPRAASGSDADILEHIFD